MNPSMSRGRIALVIAVWVLAGVAFLVYRANLAHLLNNEEEAVPAASVAFGSAERPAAPAEVWAVGDGAAGTAAGRAVAALIARAHPDRMLYLGDVYEHGSARDYRRHIETIYGGLAHRIAPTPGNHEWAVHRAGYDPYWRSVTDARTPHHYAFRIGGWRVLSLNSETPANREQLRWLRARLDAVPGTCTLAFWHRPRYSAGTHGDQPDIAPLWDAVAGRATLVLSGHDHDQQRFRPIDGTTQIVAGAGGRGRYPVDRRDERLAFADDEHYGALRLRLTPGRDEPCARRSLARRDGEPVRRPPRSLGGRRERLRERL
jgi:hypothetical protein